jgi:hypothetical protein
LDPRQKTEGRKKVFLTFAPPATPDNDVRGHPPKACECKQVRTEDLRFERRIRKNPLTLDDRLRGETFIRS